MAHIPARKAQLVVRAQMEGRAACEDGGATVHKGSRSTILHRITAPSAWTDTTFWEKRLERRGIYQVCPRKRHTTDDREGQEVKVTILQQL